MKRLALLAAAPFLLGAADPVLVPDVSERAIEIRYSFTGAELLLFGAILYPGGRTPADAADIAVVVKGPQAPIQIREKQKIAGIWINAASERFRSAPSFYAIASSRPLNDLVDERMAAIYELGLENMQLSPGAGATTAEARRFEAGLIDLRRRTGLYAEHPRGVEIREGVLYRARIDLPARVPVGEYTAETYLISKGRVLAVASRTIRIEKSGFERFVTIAAERWSFLYGACAVALSLLFGWGASLLFRRL